MAPGDEAPSADSPPAIDDEAVPPSDGSRVSRQEATATGEQDDAEGGDGGGAAGERSDGEARGPTVGPGGRREVEVPQSLYKVVTVFSTLLSVLFVVLGFVVLDNATTVFSNPRGSVIVRLLALAGPSVETLSSYSATMAALVGLVGLALIVAGAGVYVYGSRFRAPGMGKPKDEAEEGSSDG